jgi:phosphatidylglycerophosphatase A
MFNKIKKLPGEFISTSFYVGLIKFAPGTFGSLVGVFISFFLIIKFPFWIFCILTVLITLLGYFSTKKYLNAKNSLNEDPKEVVIDEVAGQMISIMSFYLFIYLIFFLGGIIHFIPKIGNFIEGILILSVYLPFMIIQAGYNSPLENYFSFILIFVTNFILFRFFDISKIFPVSYFDKKTGPFYVMADDIAAGILSGFFSIILYQIILFLYHTIKLTIFHTT